MARPNLHRLKIEQAQTGNVFASRRRFATPEQDNEAEMLAVNALEADMVADEGKIRADISALKSPDKDMEFSAFEDLSHLVQQRVASLQNNQPGLALINTSPVQNKLIPTARAGRRRDDMRPRIDAAPKMAMIAARRKALTDMAEAAVRPPLDLTHAVSRKKFNAVAALAL